jgi:hypothetical protein
VTSRYAPLVAQALERIKASGVALTLYRAPEAVDTEAAEPEKPWDADFTDQTGEGGLDAETAYTINCVVLPASKGSVEAFDVRFERGTMIESRLRSLIIAAGGLEIEPRPGDQVLYFSERWTLVGVTPVAPDGTAIIYRATIRRS